MRILGIDYGEKRIGLAVSEGKLASPVTTVSRFEDVLRFVTENKIEKIVLGLPLDAEGKEGFQAKKVREFGERLAEKTGVEVEYWNETLSTQDALRAMIESGAPQKRRRNLDSISAALILQEYLDSG